MDQAIEHNSLNPLDWLYRDTGLAPQIEPIDGTTIPGPYRDLLVHDRDMTTTLEAFVGQPLSLEVLRFEDDGPRIYRTVLLRGDRDGIRAEFGAIRIHLDALTDEEARRRIRDARRPLGGILREQSIEHHCRPAGYFRIRADRITRDALDLAGDPMLFGRHNRLFTGTALLAEVTEILPPLSDRSGATTIGSR